MQLVQSLSFFMMVIAIVFMARMVRQYFLGIKAAGELQFKLPRRPWNVDVIGAVIFMLMSSVDLIGGDRVFGAVIFIFSCWWMARGLRPYCFYEHGAILEMEYVSWDDLKSWVWSTTDKPEVTLHLAGKPSRIVRLSEGKDELERFLKGLEVR